MRCFLTGPGLPSADVEQVAGADLTEDPEGVALALTHPRDSCTGSSLLGFLGHAQPATLPWMQLWLFHVTKFVLAYLFQELAGAKRFRQSWVETIRCDPQGIG